MTWQHPLCFVPSIVVEVIHSGQTGKCRVTNEKLEKGDLRTHVYSGERRAFYLSVEGVHALAEAIDLAMKTDERGKKGVNVDEFCTIIESLSTLTQEQQASWISAIKKKKGEFFFVNSCHSFIH